MALPLGGGEADAFQAVGDTLHGAWLHLAHGAHHAAEHGAEGESKYNFNNPFLQAVLGKPSGWAFILTTVLLLVAQFFESVVHFAEHNVPKSQLPVIKGGLSELATLGFVAVLVNGVHLGGEDSFLTQISTTLFNEPELLFEEFEGIDKDLFNVTITFFAAFTVLLTVINLQFKSWDRTFKRALIQLRMTEDNEKDRRKASPALVEGGNLHQQLHEINNRVEEVMERYLQQEPFNWGFGFEELFRSSDSKLSEFYAFRKRFLNHAVEQGLSLDNDFRFYQYLEENAADDLKKIVSIEPLQLIAALVPAVGLTTIAEVVAEQMGKGDEYGTALAFIVTQVGILVWAAWNFLKMAYVKNMLKPRFVKKDGFYELLPPLYTIKEEREKPFIINQLSFLEHPFKKPATSIHGELFGIVGDAGPSFYLQSMKLLLFESIVSFSIGTNIVGKDYGELTMLTDLAILPSILAVALAPATFLMYNWATAVEQLRDNRIVGQVLAQQREERFVTTLRTLITVINKFKEVAESKEEPRRRTYDEVEREWENLVEKECPDAILELRAIFQTHDPDGSGQIEKDELLKMSTELGFRFEGAVCDRFLQTLGDKKQIDFKQFATTFMKTNNDEFISEMDPPEVADQLFGFYNTDGNDEISEDEMLDKMRPMGFSQEGVHRLFEDVTGKPKDTLSKDDFIGYLRRKVLVSRKGGKSSHQEAHAH